MLAPILSEEAVFKYRAQVRLNRTLAFCCLCGMYYCVVFFVVVVFFFLGALPPPVDRCDSDNPLDCQDSHGISFYFMSWASQHIMCLMH